MVAAGQLDRVRRLCALDISTQRGAPLFAAAVVLERGAREPLEVATAMLEPELPYIPGLLAFREAPAGLAAIERLRQPWDLLWVDGQGIAHPRGLGIASYLGVLLERPAVGVAKKRLAGEVGELGPEAGATAAILFGHEVRGFALRSRVRSNPLLVSPGHLCSPAAALAIVREHLDGYRIPVPTRLAHDAANQARRAWLGL